MNECAVAGCSKQSKCRGWCNTHYERWRRTGVVGGAKDGRSRPVKKCSVEDCNRTAKKREWCEKHYANWRTTGNPIRQKRPTYGTKRRPTTQGYVEIYQPTHPIAMKDGYVLEHRKVAWDAGLFSDPSLLIHHKDEDKKNNSLSNLEVKTPPDHMRDHVQERGAITNQYGTWPLRRKQKPQKMA